MSTGFQRVLTGLARRIWLMVGRALVVSADDAPRCQTVQLRMLGAEVKDGVEHFQEYGFTSVPKPATGDQGPEAAVVFPHGHRGHGIAVVVGDRRYRLRGLADGEVALYDDLGQVVHLKRTGIVVDSKGTLEAKALGPATITAPMLTASDGLPIPLWSVLATAAALQASCGLGNVLLQPALAQLNCAPSYVQVTPAAVTIHGPTMTQVWT